MQKRKLIRLSLDSKPVPCTPWNFTFTSEAREKVCSHFNNRDIEEVTGNHLLALGNCYGFFDNVGNDHYRDVFGVVWDRTKDKDIGVVANCVIERPTLSGFKNPPIEERLFSDIPEKIDRYGDRFRVYNIGFSLYERAWTLRGMENLMMDFLSEPAFVHDLLDTITEYNLAVIDRALEYDIDMVHLGDDWGQQRGLQMGPKMWREFLKPRLARMYKKIKDAGKYVSIHSCGDVDELFDELIHIGLDCFNPFQPEVMDVMALMRQYRGRLSFYGGLSTQRTLPYGTTENVREESQRLLNEGLYGNYIFSPAHAIEGDVPLENILTALECAKSQV